MLARAAAAQLSKLDQAIVAAGGPRAFKRWWDSIDDRKAKLRLAYDWTWRARPKQLPPAGDWAIWNVRAGRGWGKALALDTTLPTPAGWTTMADVKVGDTLFDERGWPCRVTFATEIQFGRRCFEVEFDDGTVIVADGDHRWVTWTKAARKAYGRTARPTVHPTVVTTDQIRDSLRVQRGREVNHSVKLAEPLKLRLADLPVDPYVLGVWLGDGDNHAAVVTTGDDEQWRLLEEAGTSVGRVAFDPRTHAQRATIGGKPPVRGADGRMRGNGSLHSKLRELGLLKNKHLPALYLRASPRQRIALLQGLMDTDGSCESNGNVEFCSTSRVLADGVLELALGLGMKAVICEGRAKLAGKDCGPKYRVNWTPHVPVFRLSRKLARQHSGKAQRSRTHHRYIVDVRPIATVPVRCIQVDSPTHLFLAARSMVPTHNTLTGAEWIRWRVEREGARRIALVAPTAADVRDVMVEGPSGILAVCPPWDRPKYEPSKRRLTWPNGAIATTFSADEPRSLRGPQFDTGWCDELAHWKYLEDAWDNVQFGLRMGDPRCLITSSPRALAFLRDLEADTENVHTTEGATYENSHNLPARYLKRLLDKYEGTRLGRQEIHAEILTDNPAAFWNTAMFERPGFRVHDMPEDVIRLVIGVDPAVSSNKKSDETGIVGGALCECRCKGAPELHGFLFDDKSGIYKPHEWGKIVVDWYEELLADLVVAEVNNGGELVERNIRATEGGQAVAYKPVHASKGKEMRHEPIANLYERGMVHHVGRLSKLEDQQAQWDRTQGKSPDRLDAATEVLTELMLGVERKPAEVAVTVIE